MHFAEFSRESISKLGKGRHMAVGKVGGKRIFS
jgi:hypothetical protein